MAASLPDEPYRQAVATPLEALVHRGPVGLRPIGPAPRSPLLPINLGQIALILGIVQGWGLMLTLSLAGTLMVLPPFVSAIVDQVRWDRAFAAVGAALSGLPFPVEGYSAWRIVHPAGFGPLEVELRAAHPLAAPAIHSAEPDAEVSWPEEHVLRVTLSWTRSVDDLERLRHLLVDVLAAHADELGVARVRCLRWTDLPGPMGGVEL